MDATVMKNDEKAIFALRSLYRKFGYDPFKMSRFEEYDLYVRNKDFLVSDEVITFTDRSGRLLALKPDVTLSIIKNTEDREGMVQKVYYDENVFRVAKGTHTFKEIMQAGLECIGDLGAYEIGEVVLLAARSLSLLGERYMLDLSHMGLISALLEESGLSEEGAATALSYLHQKSRHELMALCQKENLSEQATQKLLLLIKANGAPQKSLSELAPMISTPKEKEAFNEFCGLCRILEAQGEGKNIRVDFSVGNDMKYYSGVVFKGYLEGVPAGVLSGGQYDKLLRKLGRKSGAIGFAVYLDQLERMEGAEEFDVDTLLLYEDGADTAALLKRAEELSKEGSVRVVSRLPEEINCRRVVRFEEA